jgi:hypothetical protein
MPAPATHDILQRRQVPNFEAQISLLFHLAPPFLVVVPLVQLSLCPLLRQAESDTHIGKALNETFTLQCLQCASSVSPSRDVLQRLQIPNFDV